MVAGLWVGQVRTASRSRKFPLRCHPRARRRHRCPVDRAMTVPRLPVGRGSPPRHPVTCARVCHGYRTSASFQKSANVTTTPSRVATRTPSTQLTIDSRAALLVCCANWASCGEVIRMIRAKISPHMRGKMLPTGRHNRLMIELLKHKSRYTMWKSVRHRVTRSRLSNMLITRSFSDRAGVEDFLRQVRICGKHVSGMYQS